MIWYTFDNTLGGILSEANAFADIEGQFTARFAPKGPLKGHTHKWFYSSFINFKVSFMVIIFIIILSHFSSFFIKFYIHQNVHFFWLFGVYFWSIYDHFYQFYSKFSHFYSILVVFWWYLAIFMLFLAKIRQYNGVQKTWFFKSKFFQNFSDFIDDLPYKHQFASFW